MRWVAGAIAAAGALAAVTLALIAGLSDGPSTPWSQLALVALGVTIFGLVLFFVDRARHEE